MTTQPVNHPLPLPVKEPNAPTCGMPYLDWQGKDWRCCLPPEHFGDHYGQDGRHWSFWAKGHPRIDEYGRQWCAVCELEVFGDADVAQDGEIVCSHYCRGRQDERIGVRTP